MAKAQLHFSHSHLLLLLLIPSAKSVLQDRQNIQADPQLSRTNANQEQQEMEGK
jgi:hypothetical protein